MGKEESMLLRGRRNTDDAMARAQSYYQQCAMDYKTAADACSSCSSCSSSTRHGEQDMEVDYADSSCYTPPPSSPCSRCIQAPVSVPHRRHGHREGLSSDEGVLYVLSHSLPLSGRGAGADGDDGHPSFTMLLPDPAASPVFSPGVQMLLRDCIGRAEKLLADDDGDEEGNASAEAHEAEEDGGEDDDIEAERETRASSWSPGDTHATYLPSERVARSLSGSAPSSRCNSPQRSRSILGRGAASPWNFVKLPKKNKNGKSVVRSPRTLLRKRSILYAALSKAASLRGGTKSNIVRPGLQTTGGTLTPAESRSSGCTEVDETASSCSSSTSGTRLGHSPIRSSRSILEDPRSMDVDCHRPTSLPPITVRPSSPTCFALRPSPLVRQPAQRCVRVSGPGDGDAREVLRC